MCSTCKSEPAQKNGYCKPCRSAYNAAWYQANKEYQGENTKKNRKKYSDRNMAIIYEAKSAPCADCGGTFHPVQMDFDHIGDDKEDNVSSMRVRAESVLRAEIAKCEVVCSNCHRMRTYLRYHATVA